MALLERAHAGSRLTSPERAPYGVAVLAVLGCAYLAVNDPNDAGALMPTCPTKAVTGLDCPACGGLRMVRALLYGDVGAAARANALLLVLAPVAVAGWVMWCLRARRGAGAGLALSRAWAVAVLAATAIWTLARNLT